MTVLVVFALLFVGSKLVGDVVEVRNCVDYVGGCGAAFPLG